MAGVARPAAVVVRAAGPEIPQSEPSGGQAPRGFTYRSGVAGQGQEPCGGLLREDRAPLTHHEELAIGVVLGRGYVGLAEWVGGQAEGRARWQAACDTFREQLKDEARRGDAQVGLDQLETVRKRYAAQA